MHHPQHCLSLHCHCLLHYPMPSHHHPAAMLSLIGQPLYSMVFFVVLLVHCLYFCATTHYIILCYTISFQIKRIMWLQDSLFDGMINNWGCTTYQSWGVCYEINLGIIQFKIFNFIIMKPSKYPQKYYINEVAYFPAVLDLHTNLT
jgi:hypothetical protein